MKKPHLPAKPRRKHCARDRAKHRAMIIEPVPWELVTTCPKSGRRSVITISLARVPFLEREVMP